MINIGTLELADAYVGSTPIEKAYIGSQLLWEKSSPAPIYNEIEYLESTPSGSNSLAYSYGQRIALFTPTINDEVEVKFMVLAKTNAAFFGSRTEPYRFCCATFSSGASIAFAMTNNSWPSQRATVSVDSIYTMSAKNGSYSINGDEYSTTQLSSATFGDFLMFCCRGSNNVFVYTKIRCYYVTVKRDGVLIHDFIPVRVGTTGYMYDRIGGNLLGNVGTGNFVLGPDVT